MSHHFVDDLGEAWVPEYLNLHLGLERLILIVYSLRNLPSDVTFENTDV